jgi:ubiquinone/menaquinone biosynthesis C-methylase UbiE
MPGLRAFTMATPASSSGPGRRHMNQIAQERELSRIRNAYEQRRARRWKRRYTIAEPGNVLRIEEIQHRMLGLLVRRFGSDLRATRILEVGCGSGYWLRQLIQWGAAPENLFGIDLLADRIATARELCPSAVGIECGDASRLRFDEHTFDAVLQFTVFTSVLDAGMKKAMAGEILRVLKPGGCVLWYDFFVNNPANRDVRGVSKKEIRQLFPACRVQLERVTLVPPLGRMLGKISPSAYRAISAMKVLCTHHLGFIEKTSASAN